MTEGQAGAVKLGDRVQVTYEINGDRKIVNRLERRARGLEGQETTNFGSTEPLTGLLDVQLDWSVADPAGANVLRAERRYRARAGMPRARAAPRRRAS